MLEVATPFRGELLAPTSFDFVGPILVDAKKDAALISRILVVVGAFIARGGVFEAGVTKGSSSSSGSSSCSKIIIQN